METIMFLASLPPIQSALNIGGAKGDGSRLKLDVPGSEMAQVARMILMQGKLLKVTIEEIEYQDDVLQR